MPEPKITVQGTPNPNAAKFTLDRRLIEGDESHSYFDPESASEDPLAESLFALDGVESLLIADNFVTVTKSPSTSWDELVPDVERTIREALAEAD
jgi:hypothetical protein